MFCGGLFRCYSAGRAFRGSRHSLVAIWNLFEFNLYSSMTAAMWRSAHNCVASIMDWITKQLGIVCGRQSRRGAAGQMCCAGEKRLNEDGHAAGDFLLLLPLPPLEMWQRICQCQWMSISHYRMGHEADDSRRIRYFGIFWNVWCCFGRVEAW